MLIGERGEAERAHNKRAPEGRADNYSAIIP